MTVELGMPQCMEMMKGMDFPMKEMMFKMMGGS